MNIKNTIDSQVHLFTVKNNDRGIKTIETFRKQLKGSPHRLHLYGRGYRFGKGRMHKRSDGSYDTDNRYQNNIPLTKAENIAVYIKSV